MDPFPPAPPTPVVPSTSDERMLGIVMHILGLIGFPIIGPLVVWIMKKDTSEYINHQGRELLNFQLTYLIYSLISFLLIFVLIGIPMLVVVGIASLVFTVIGIVSASEGRVYRFPWIFRFL